MLSIALEFPFTIDPPHAPEVFVRDCQGCGENLMGGRGINTGAVGAGLVLGVLLLALLHAAQPDRPAIELSITDDDGGVPPQSNFARAAVAPRPRSQESAVVDAWADEQLNQKRAPQKAVAAVAKDSVPKHVEKPKTPQFSLLVNTCFPGGTTGNSDVANVEACANKCIEVGQDKCTHFTYNSVMVGQRCRLKFTTNLETLKGVSDPTGKCVSGKAHSGR
eukprot:m.133405 g.133405  ORF g.133405 m.133405 type:complete len:220 (-) comp13835_c0_seq3:159-818(-)